MKSNDFVMKKNKKIIPIRIREARLARGLTLTELAERVGVTKQAISKYELGAVNISSTILMRLVDVLNFPIEFFFKYKENVNESLSMSPVFFRSPSLAKRTKDAMEQRMDFVCEIVFYLKKYINFPKVDICNLDNGEDKEFLDDIEIEAAALKLREYWQLGEKPISNLTNLLLRKGFIISKADLYNEKVDAYSRWISGMPLIVIGSEKDTAVRYRFSLAHELGHLVLHQYLEDSEVKKNHKQIEKEANRFASAFLLPSQSFSNDIYSTSLDSFVYLKKKWKVSISAMIRRCYDLDLITDLQYTNMNRYLNVKQWKTNEPLDDVLEFEKPTMIKEAFDLLINNNIVSPIEIVEYIALNKEEIEELCFLPEGYFQNLIANITKPNLKLI